MTVRDDVALAWHRGSDHAADGVMLGGPLCNCVAVADRMMPILRDAWANGAMQGHDDHEFGVEEWTNPYEGDRHEGQ